MPAVSRRSLTFSNRSDSRRTARTRLSRCCTKARRSTNSAIDGTRRRDTLFAIAELADKPQIRRRARATTGRPVAKLPDRPTSAPRLRRCCRQGCCAVTPSMSSAGRRGGPTPRRFRWSAYEQFSVRLAAATEGGGACQPVYPGGTAGPAIGSGRRSVSGSCCPAPVLQSSRLRCPLARTARSRVARSIAAPIMAGASLPTADRWRLRAAMDAIVAQRIRARSRADYERILASFSHKSFTRGARALSCGVR